MRKELLTICSKIKIQPNSPYFEYCFSALDNSIHKRDSEYCFLTITFILNKNATENNIQIEVKAFNKIQDADEVKIIETYLDEAIKIENLTRYDSNANSIVNLLLPISLTNEQVQEIESWLEECNTIAMVYSELVYEIYTNMLNIGMNRVTLTNSLGSSLHYFRDRKLFDNFTEAMQDMELI